MKPSEKKVMMAAHLNREKKKCPTLRPSFVIHGPPRGVGLVSVWYSEYEGVSVGVCLYAERIETFFGNTSTSIHDYFQAEGVCVCDPDYVCVCRHL